MCGGSHRLLKQAGPGLRRLVWVLVLCSLTLSGRAGAQGLEAARDDQINRLRLYILDAIQPSGLVRDSVVLNGSSFHPASPDAAGFALVGLAALDHVDKFAAAESRVLKILRAYAGETAGVNPDRSADGHFIHWMDTSDGSRASGGWPVEYTPIGSALLIAGAQFARNHFTDNDEIAALADELTNTVDFNAAIHPSLDGSIYLTMNQNGGGSSANPVRPWNEYMLVESLALKQPNNDRAVAVLDDWLDVSNLPKRSYMGIETLTDNPGAFAPAFWVQQMQFFNGDFRYDAGFQTYLENQRAADDLYSTIALGESSRYGLTAGLRPPLPLEDPPVDRYHADRIEDHPNDVFSPEAVTAWGDMDAFLDFYNNQFPTSDPRYKYGVVRESAVQPDWVPFDAGLVDHLFLLFGLIESIDADFFAERVFVPYIPGDFDDNGVVAGPDFLEWQMGIDDHYDAADLDDWESNYAFDYLAATPVGHSVPEPATLAIAVGALLLTVSASRARARQLE